MKDLPLLTGVNHAETILAKATANTQRYGRRSPVLDQYTEPYNKIVPIPYNYDSLTRLWLHNEVTRTVGEAIIKEVGRNNPTPESFIKPKFQSKCLVCGTTYQAKKTMCPQCNNADPNLFAEPDPDQKKIAEAFLMNPNRDNTLDQINESILRYALSVDDHWVSFQAADINTLTPPTIQVEDSVYMRVVWDEKRGTIGDPTQMFCPICTKEMPAQCFNEDERCRLHSDLELKETVAVYDKGGVKARFARDEIYHGMIDPWLPGFYGNSRLIAALRLVMSVTAMDKFNLDNYASGKLAKILVCTGITEDQSRELIQSALDSSDYAQEINPLTQELVTKLRIKAIGLPLEGKVTSIDAMPPSEKMQNLDWWRLWREAFCGLYGVTPIFVGIVEQGKTGNNPRMQIDVDNNTTEHFQAAPEAVYNTFVFPKLGITDWVFEYDAVEEKDEMQDTAILQAKLNAMSTAVSLGLTVELTDEGEVKVSGQPLTAQEKQQMAMETMQAQAEAQGKTSKDENAKDEGKKQSEGDKGFKGEKLFPTEKSFGKVKSQWIVKEIEKADEEGSWVTINGVHVLIRSGESTADAFKRTTGKDLEGGSGDKSGGDTQNLNTPSNQVGSGEQNVNETPDKLGFVEDPEPKVKLYAQNINENFQQKRLSGGLNRMEATPEDKGRIRLTFFNNQGEEELHIFTTTEGHIDPIQLSKLPYNAQISVKKIVGEWAPTKVN